jgi:hypothetical protein
LAGAGSVRFGAAGAEAETLRMTGPRAVGIAANPPEGIGSPALSDPPSQAKVATSGITATGLA